MFSLSGKMDDLWVCLKFNWFLDELINRGSERVDFGNCNWFEEDLRVFCKCEINFGFIPLDTDFSINDKIFG